MYLRESKQKRVDGSLVVYLQLAENVWNPEKRRAETRIVCNCGRADDPAVTERLRRLARSILRRCSPQEIVADDPQWRLVCAYPYGPLYALQALWSHFGIDEIIRAQAGSRRLGFDVERALFAMVANRGCAPASKLYCYEQWLKEDVHIAGTEALRLHQLYRAMDFLEANKDSIEREIFFRVADLCNLDVEVIFYDTTSLHFEIDEEDHGSAADDTVRGSRAAGAKTYRALRKRGHSKNGRFDAPQIVVGLAVTRDGFPVRHWVFPGNTVDVTTVARVKQELRGWQLTRCVFVGDAGMVSAANFHALAAGGGKYIMCMPVRHGEEVAVHVLSRPGRYQSVTENLQVKEVWVGDGERLDGKFVVHSNDDTLTAADMALGYKQLQRVEQAWRDMKSGLKLRPVFHWAVHRIHAHVAITVLALLLERAAEHACADTWRNIRDDLERIQLAQLLSPHGTVWQITEPTPEATKRLKSLRISPPPPILSLT